MGKTKEQILKEQKIQLELDQAPLKERLELLRMLGDVLTLSKPVDHVVGFGGEETKWESVWDETQRDRIKEKILILVRDIK